MKAGVELGVHQLKGYQRRSYAVPAEHTPALNEKVALRPRQGWYTWVIISKGKGMAHHHHRTNRAVMARMAKDRYTGNCPV